MNECICTELKVENEHLHWGQRVSLGRDTEKLLVSGLSNVSVHILVSVMKLLVVRLEPAAIENGKPGCSFYTDILKK